MKTTIVVLVVGLFAVGIPALVRYTVQAVRDHHLANTQTPRPASCPSTGAGRGHDTPCARMDCDQPATNHVIASGEWWAFCEPHALPYLTAPYDQERDVTDRDFREVMDDARRITREASGGVA